MFEMDSGIEGPLEVTLQEAFPATLYSGGCLVKQRITLGSGGAGREQSVLFLMIGI